MSPDDSGGDRYLILLEQIQGQVQLIAEGYDQLDQKLDRVERNLQKQIKDLETAIWRRIAVLERQRGTLSH